MSSVQIQRLPERYDFNDFLFGRWAEHARRIEHRAYRLFEKRGHIHGRDMDDWLQAEREVDGGSTCELTIGDKAATIVITAPGFSAADLSVRLALGWAVIEGNADQQAVSEKGDVITDEEITRSLFHKIALPESADIDAASTVFKGDELRITIPLKSTQLAALEPKALAKTAN